MLQQKDDDVATKNPYQEKNIREAGVPEHRKKKKRAPNPPAEGGQNPQKQKQQQPPKHRKKSESEYLSAYLTPKKKRRAPNPNEINNNTVNSNINEKKDQGTGRNASKIYWYC